MVSAFHPEWWVNVLAGVQGFALGAFLCNWPRLWRQIASTYDLYGTQEPKVT